MSEDTLTPEEEARVSAAIALSSYDKIEPSEGSVLLCARIIHRVIEAMNETHNELTLSWEQSRDSLLGGVLRVIENPNETPEENHNEWMRSRAAEGWIYGQTKDPKAKTHPCMLPYGALGAFQRSKDVVFLVIVREFFGLEKKNDK